MVGYTYDAEGRRVAETTPAGTKKYIIDAQLLYGQVIAETNGGGSLTCSYVFGEDRISMTRGSVTHFYQADGQGSVRQLTDAGGNVTDTWTYSAFGEILGRTGTTINAFTYTGEQWDPNAGFYYLRARWYKPSTGTFTSVDPWEGDPEILESLHRYSYANASPISYTDPSGMMTLVEVQTAQYVQSNVQRAQVRVNYIGQIRTVQYTSRLRNIQSVKNLKNDSNYSGSYETIKIRSW